MAYERINFRDYPNTTTPLDEVNLNRMDSELKYLDDNTIENDYWNASTSYDVGAFVIYENKLYRALVQNTNVAPNTSSVTWEQTNLTETLTSHNDEIVNLKAQSGQTLNLLENNNFEANGVPFNLFRLGKLRILNTSIKCKEPFNSNPGQLCFSLDSADAPSKFMVFTKSPSFANTSGVPIRVLINTDGNVYIRYGTANVAYDIDLAWIVA